MQRSGKGGGVSVAQVRSCVFYPKAGYAIFFCLAALEGLQEILPAALSDHFCVARDFNTSTAQFCRAIKPRATKRSIGRKGASFRHSDIFSVLGALWIEASSCLSFGNADTVDVESG